MARTNRAPNRNRLCSNAQYTFLASLTATLPLDPSSDLLRLQNARNRYQKTRKVLQASPKDRSIHRSGTFRGQPTHQEFYEFYHSRPLSEKTALIPKVFQRNSA